MIKFVIRFAILSILVATFVTGMGGISSSVHASPLVPDVVSKYQRPETCGVYNLVKSTTPEFNEAAYGLQTRLYSDSCNNAYVVAEGFVPEGEPAGGYLCAVNNCLVTGGGLHFGSYYDVDSPVKYCVFGGSFSTSFDRLNGSSAMSDVIYC